MYLIIYFSIESSDICNNYPSSKSNEKIFYPYAKYIDRYIRPSSLVLEKDFGIFL